MFNILLVTCLTEVLEWYRKWCIGGKTTVFNRQLVKYTSLLDVMWKNYSWI